MTSTSSKSRAAVMTDIVITVDHVYLPVAPGGNSVEAWPASNVFTSKVSRGACLQVPADLATFLLERGQAQIVSAPPKAGAS
jgi:hypothetical protein